MQQMVTIRLYCTCNHTAVCRVEHETKIL